MLTGPPAVDLSGDASGGNDGFDHVVSLHRLLNDAADSGVEQDVLVACAEALLAWDGLEFVAYAEDPEGVFVLATATPGAIGAGPATLPASVVTSQEHFVRLSASESTALGFNAERDTCLSLTDGAGFQPWLLAFSGTLPEPPRGRRFPRKPTEALRQGPWPPAGIAGKTDAGRTTRPGVDLSIVKQYAEVLADGLSRAAAIAEARTRWAVLLPLLEPTLTPEQAGEAALEELAREVGAQGATLTLTTADGTLVLDLSSVESAPAAHVPVVRDHVAATVPALEDCTMTVAAWRASSPAFGKREQRLVERVSVVFGDWLREAWETSPSVIDRRADSRGFASVIDRTAARLVADASDVTVVVLAPPRAMLKPGRIQDWVARIRSELRPSDLAGAVSAREIAVLLSGATRDHLAAVRARLRRSLSEDVVKAGGTPPRIAFGAASRAAGSTSESSLVRLARQDAVRRTMGASDPWL